MEENNNLEVQNEAFEAEEREMSFFKKFLKALGKGYLIIIILSIIFSLTALLVSNFVVKDETMIKFSFRYTIDLNLNANDIISKENIDKVKNVSVSYYTGSKISTYKYVEIENISIEEDSKNTYTIYVNKSAFNLQDKEGNVNYNDSAAKGFLKHLVIISLPEELYTEYEQYDETNNGKTIKGIIKVFDNDYYEENSLSSENVLLTAEKSGSSKKTALIQASIYGFLIGFGISIIVILIFTNQITDLAKREYDNETIYRTPFHRSFFRNSLNTFKDIKSLVIIALLLSCVMACKFIPIPSGFGDLGLSFSFLFLAVACMLFGPYPSLMIGVISDVVGYLIMPNGDFFIGYTIQSMFACFVYALCFHKTYLTFTRAFIARVLVNLVANVVIGTISRSIMYGLSYDATMTYLLLTSLPKNIIYLLPQSLLLFFVLKAVSRPLYHLNLMDERIAMNLSFF
jgi:ECF transporter S component (folate family)